MSKINSNIENEILNRYNNGETCRAIAKTLGFVHATISSVLKKNKINVKLFNRLIVPENLHKEIVGSYQNKTLNTYELGRKYGVSYGAIRNLLLSYNIPMRTKEERMRKYAFDETFFDKIDTQEKSYILGFLYADGYNNGKYGIVINLHKKDTHILKSIAEAMNYKGRVYENVRNNQSTFSLSSKKLVEQLNKLGCVQAKSLILKFPTKEIVPDNLINHFIRGYMDGDGCIAIEKRNSQGNVSFVGSYDFIDKLQEVFINKFGFVGYKRIKNKIKELVYGGQNQSLTILNWLYQDATIYLTRKYDKYQLIKNRPNKR